MDSLSLFILKAIDNAVFIVYYEMESDVRMESRICVWRAQRLVGNPVPKERILKAPEGGVT